MEQDPQSIKKLYEDELSQTKQEETQKQKDREDKEKKDAGFFIIVIVSKR